MKVFAGLFVLTIAVAFVLACDPDGDNKPECSSSNLNQTVRNFWDPTHYWLCTSAGAEPESVRCPDAQGFDAVSGQCVHFSEWDWIEPCPEADVAS